MHARFDGLEKLFKDISASAFQRMANQDDPYEDNEVRSLICMSVWLFGFLSGSLCCVV